MPGKERGDRADGLARVRTAKLLPRGLAGRFVMLVNDED
jgi:hypothetical protein